MLYVRSNVALEEGEAMWIRCLLLDRGMKSFWQKQNKYLELLWT